MSGFEPFAKIPRLSRNMVITEKLDGTNAQIVIAPDDGLFAIDRFDGLTIRAGSRNRWIEPGDDNYGFALWVQEHAAELIRGLGEGKHFGEWWGQGIQRRYGLEEKRFSLFNVGRWTEDNKPVCCHVVPTLAIHSFDSRIIDNAMEDLRVNGSRAAPGFMKPEGIIVHHSGSMGLFKKTFEMDGTGKERAA